MVHGGSEAAGPEEVNTVKVGDVHTPAGTEGTHSGLPELCSVYFHTRPPDKHAERQINAEGIFKACSSILTWCKQSSKAEEGQHVF